MVYILIRRTRVPLVFGPYKNRREAERVLVEEGWEKETGGRHTIWYKWYNETKRVYACIRNFSSFEKIPKIGFL